MSTHPSEKPNKDGDLSFLKFSGLAFEMLAFILLGLLAGYKMDQFLEMNHPVFTAILSLLAVIFSIVHLIRKLPKH